MATFTKIIPDNITSWMLTGFSLNESTGFAMTENPTKITTFQPFFLCTNLPYSIKRGEVITIPVLVFNYTAKDLDVQIVLNNEHGEYDFTDVMCSGSTMTKSVSAPSQDSANATFVIKPKVLGDIMLKFKALSPVAEDVLHQRLKVEPEGETQHKNDALFVTIPKGGEPVKHIFRVEIPLDAVLGSEYLEFIAVGDILGPTLKNLDQLIRLPSGCGEQNMIHFVPNILVLQYLEALQKDMPLIVHKAKKYMETGYQRQLTYKHTNGAYSAFGERYISYDNGFSQPNSWLTAYVVRSFLQARKFITIDEKIIDAAFQYLIKTQKRNGQFPQTGELFTSSNQNKLGVSAFILLAFLEDQVSARYVLLIYISWK